MKILSQDDRRCLFILENVRLSFPELWEPKSYKGGTPRYGASFHIEKKSEQDKQIQNMLKELVQSGWGNKGLARLKDFWGDKMKICYRPGKREEEEGQMVLTAYRYEDNGRPLIIDQRCRQLEQSSGIPYGGCYVNPKIEIYLQDGDTVGIRASLIGVQFVKDGPSFGGSAPASADGFDSLEDDGDAADFDTATDSADSTEEVEDNFFD